MPVIQVVAPGMLTTVQDLGREGFGPMGVSASGAADPISLRVGNRLAGNPESAAGLEMTLLGGKFLFRHGSTIALTGSDFGAAVEETRVEPYTSFQVLPGQTLSMGSTRSGARCYLCVHGGIVVDSFLGSASTHILSGLGGFEGRPLLNGDILQLGAATNYFRQRKLGKAALKYLSPRKILRVTPGPQSDWFPEASQCLFYSQAYQVTEESNRMGLRLQGKSVSAYPQKTMITEGVSLGAIQVLESGMPIILFVEQQTTGGYPKIANVIAADLLSLGQLRPRDQIQFEKVDWETARILFAETEQVLSSKQTIVE